MKLLDIVLEILESNLKEKKKPFKGTGKYAGSKKPVSKNDKDDKNDKNDKDNKEEDDVFDPLGDFIKQAGGGDSGLSKVIGANENLRNWFKKEKWKRIDTQGNIAGDCGTMPKGKKTQRCLPAAKARSLTKKQRAATSRKKTASNKQFVKNTKAAKVKLKK